MIYWIDLQLDLWGYNNFIKHKSNKIRKLNLNQSNIKWQKPKKYSIWRKKDKKNNSSKLRENGQTHNPDHENRISLLKK
jgi:hypothetical protein